MLAKIVKSPVFQPLPAPIVVGVFASMFPISGPILAGVMTTTVVFTGLTLLTASE
jgi:hypothetical protein